MGHLSARFAYMLVKDTCSHICSRTFNLRFSVSPRSVPMQPEQQDSQNAQVRNACFTMSPAMQSDDLKSHQQDWCALTSAVVAYTDEGDGLLAEGYVEFKTPMHMSTLGKRLPGANSSRRSGTPQRAAHSCREGASGFCTCASREQGKRSDVLRRPSFRARQRSGLSDRCDFSEQSEQLASMDRKKNMPLKRSRSRIIT